MTRGEPRITSTTQFLSTVLYSGRFRVSWHQRHYDWTSQEVDDLLHDLKDACDVGKTCYFLGSIMLLEASGNEPQRINDGQQRLITFSLMMSAFCRRFAEQRPVDTGREKMALEVLFERSQNEVSRLTEAPQYTPRIVAPRNDRPVFTQIICGSDIGSNGPLMIAWRKVDRFISSMNREARESLFDFLLQNVEVSVLMVPSDVDANRVFETLNGRGKKLSETDLIRNLLYSHFSRADDNERKNNVHNSLQGIGLILKANTNRTITSQYFRCYLQCYYGFLRERRFYREFSNKAELTIRGAGASDKAYDLVQGLGRQDNIQLFRTIHSGKLSSILEGRLPTISGKRHLNILLEELKNYSVAHPLCYALLHRYIVETGNRKQTGKIVARSLKNLNSFIMRSVFVTTSFRSSRFATPLAECAHTVFMSTNLKSLDIADDLERADASGVLDDSSFIQKMTDMRMSNNTKALRYLFGINAHGERGADALRIGGCSVEHVLPESARHWPGWIGFKDVNPADWIYRAGNLVLLSRNENRSDDEFNANYDNKRTALAKSPLLMARTVATDYEGWTPDIIKRRSQQLATVAARIWTFRSVE